jgi:histidinol-phosphate/aromatic aminotransferase/cobyric acid decarboxylase-like protein
MLQRLDLRDRGLDFRGALPRPNLAGDEPVAEVRAIVLDVRARGDVALPYHLEALTQAAGILALGFGDEMRARVAGTVKKRSRVAKALAELPVEVWPSQANFILFRVLPCDASQVWQALLDGSVIVHDVSTWSGLEGCLRVTIGATWENDRFLSALEQVLSHRRLDEPPLK